MVGGNRRLWGMSQETNDSSQLAPEKMQILVELNEAFGGDRDLIATYLGRFGWSKVVAPNIRIVKREAEEAKEKAERAAAKDASSGEEDSGTVEKDPFYQIEVVCPACETAFEGDVLRSKALVLDYVYKDKYFPLLVPEAKGTMKNYKAEDPLVRSVLVCPGCLYAAPSANYFVSDSAVSGSQGFISQLAERRLRQLKAAVEEDHDERLRIAGEQATRGDWTHDRTPEIASVCFQLSGRTLGSLVEVESRLALPAAESYLSAAKLSSDLEDSETETECLRKARELLEKAYEFSGSAALPVYLLSVVNFQLGDPKTARTWASKILTDRGQLHNSIRYKRYVENLNDQARAAMKASGEETTEE